MSEGIMLLPFAALVVGFAGLAVWAFGTMKPARSLREVAHDASTAWLKENLPARIREIISDELRKPENAWFLFVKQIQWFLHEADHSMSDAETMRRAKQAYSEFLKDESCEYGTPVSHGMVAEQGA